MSVPTRRILDPVFGKATLTSGNNGKANWERGSTSPLDQKGATGWLARLYGGVQTGDDWARVNISVDEKFPADFNAAQWSYYMSATEVYGVNIVIWMHDPKDDDKRIEVTQAPSHTDLEKSAGWNAHELDTSVTQFFFYGENTTGTGLTAGTQYTWAEFQSDVLFKTWTIYRITLEYGWYSTGTFDEVHVADIKLDGQVIRLGPESGTHKKTVLTTKTVVGGANSADDVISESTDAGTDWDFDFGGTGYITKAILVSATNAITPRCTLQLYSRPPTCNLFDNVAATSPVAADVPFFLGEITFEAMHDKGSGHSYAIATPSTYGNPPLEFDVSKIYGVLISDDACTPGNVLWSILLTADMENN